jgi:predicted acyl esterase
VRVSAGMTFKKGFLAIFLAISLLCGLAFISVLINRLEIIKTVWNLPEYSHEMGDQQELMLAMSDGIKLRTLQQFPKGDGPWPTVLIRNPYDTMGSDLFNVFCELFVNYGYACVYQEARGQMLSEGEWEPLVNEPNDTSDTLYWIADQNWNDGNIGMWGVSYLALTQWAGALDYPSELKTFAPTSMGTDFHKIIYEKGNFRLFLSLWILLMPDRGTNIEGVFNFWEAAEHFPHNEIDTMYAGKKLTWYQDWIRDVGIDDYTWQRDDAIAVKKIAENLSIPVLIYEGWYDPFFKAELQDYQNLASRSKSRMVIGPWSHIQQPATSLNVDVSDAIKLSLQANLEWFDYYLKGNKNADASAYIEIFDLGANQWKRYDSWPPTTENLRFGLMNLENANDCESGKLIKVSESLTEQNTDILELLNEEDDVLNVDESEAFIDEAIALSSLESNLENVSYFYDPRNPVQSRGGSGFLGPLNVEVRPGALTQNGFCEREDVLTFQSEDFDESVTIAGNVIANLTVSSDAEDTAFTAKLMDVDPNGVAINIRDTISTLSYRNDSTQALEYTPTSIVDMTLDMWAIEWTLKAGHHLRLDISSSNFPAYNIHSNYAGNWASQERVKTAKQTVYSGSELIVPVISLNKAQVKPEEALSE